MYSIFIVAMGTSESKVLVIVPTYNEGENVRPLTAGILSHLENPHILFIDDSSPDGTGEAERKLSTENPRVHVMSRPRKMGLGTAYIRGFSFALEGGYDIVFEMDADLSHDPAELPRFVGMTKEFDLVIGSRYIPGGGTTKWGWMREAVSRGGNAYARAILGCPLTDLTSGYRCYTRRALEAIDLTSIRAEGYAFQIEMAYRIWRKGLRVGELPIVFSDRERGKSKMSWGIFFEAVLGVWRMRLTG